MRVLLVRDHQEGQHAEARGQHARDGGRGVRVREVRLCDEAQGQDEDAHGQGIGTAHFPTVLRERWRSP